jgi:hypothetical protein
MNSIFFFTIPPAVKVDLLKSALEINHGKISNPMLRKDEKKNSDQSLRSIHAESAPKLHSHYGSKNISQSRIEVLDEAEVSKLLTTSGVVFSKNFFV